MTKKLYKYKANLIKISSNCWVFIYKFHSFSYLLQHRATLSKCTRIRDISKRKWRLWLANVFAGFTWLLLGFRRCCCYCYCYYYCSGSCCCSCAFHRLPPQLRHMLTILLCVWVCVCVCLFVYLCVRLKIFSIKL